MASFLTGPLLGVPASVVTQRAAGAPARSSRCRCARATRPRGACLEALPGQLDRVDALLAEGVIGGERPNAADFQIAPSVRLMLNFDQLREHIDARPAGRHARALVPGLPRPIPGSVPAAWLPF